MPRVSVIVGSVRRNRFAHKPAAWIHGHLARRPDVQSELLDLLDYPMPFYEEPISPARKQAPYGNAVVEAWTARIRAADGFVMVSPEYNHSFPAVLKNAIDYVYPEWVRKPVAFIGYGGTGGVRAIEQLRLVTVELQMAPLRAAIHLPLEILIAHRQGEAGRREAGCPRRRGGRHAGRPALVDQRAPRRPRLRPGHPPPPAISPSPARLA